MTHTRRPPAILIGGCGYGAGNIGDEGILTGLLRLVREVSPRSRVGVIAAGEKDVRRMHGVEAWRNWPAYRVFSIMRQFDVFVCGGATLADDTLNPHYPIRYCSWLIAFARFQGMPVLISAIGANRFGTREGAFLVRRFYGAADRITVRDEPSRRVLEGIGIRCDIQVTADPAFLAEPAPPEVGLRILRESGVTVGRGPLVGVSVVNEVYGERGEYKQAVAAACDALVEQRAVTPVFVCHDCRPDFDAVAVRETLSHMAHRRAARILQRRFYAPDEMLSTISHFDMTLGMRMHFLIFSAVAGVPFGAVSRADKVDNFCRLFGERPLASVRSARGNTLPATVVGAFDRRAELAGRIAARRSAIRTDAARTSDALAACLRQARAAGGRRRRAAG